MLQSSATRLLADGSRGLHGGSSASLSSMFTIETPARADWQQRRTVAAVKVKRRTYSWLGRGGAAAAQARRKDVNDAMRTVIFFAPLLDDDERGAAARTASKGASAVAARSRTLRRLARARARLRRLNPTLVEASDVAAAFEAAAHVPPNSTSPQFLLEASHALVMGRDYRSGRDWAEAVIAYEGAPQVPHAMLLCAGLERRLGEAKSATDRLMKLMELRESDRMDSLAPAQRERETSHGDDGGDKTPAVDDDDLGLSVLTEAEVLVQLSWTYELWMQASPDEPSMVAAGGDAESDARTGLAHGALAAAHRLVRGKAAARRRRAEVKFTQAVGHAQRQKKVEQQRVDGSAVPGGYTGGPVKRTDPSAAIAVALLTSAAATAALHSAEAWRMSAAAWLLRALAFAEVGCSLLASDCFEEALRLRLTEAGAEDVATDYDADKASRGDMEVSDGRAVPRVLPRAHADVEAPLWLEGATEAVACGNMHVARRMCAQTVAVLPSLSCFGAGALALLRHCAESPVDEDDGVDDATALASEFVAEVTAAAERRARAIFVLMVRRWRARRRTTVAARAIQRKVRAHLARRWAAMQQWRKRDAAVRVQVVARGRFARHRTQQLRVERAIRAALERHSVLLIQRTWRQHVDTQERRAAAHAAAMLALREALPIEAAAVGRGWGRHRAALIITLRMRGLSARRRLARVRRAVLRLQCWHRGFLARVDAHFRRSTLRYVGDELAQRQDLHAGLKGHLAGLVTAFAGTPLDKFGDSELLKLAATVRPQAQPAGAATTSPSSASPAGGVARASRLHKLAAGSSDAASAARARRAAIAAKQQPAWGAGKPSAASQLVREAAEKARLVARVEELEGTIDGIERTTAAMSTAMATASLHALRDEMRDPDGKFSWRSTVTPPRFPKAWLRADRAARAKARALVASGVAALPIVARRRPKPKPAAASPVAAGKPETAAAAAQGGTSGALRVTGKQRSPKRSPASLVPPQQAALSPAQAAAKERRRKALEAAQARRAKAAAAAKKRTTKAGSEKKHARGGAAKPRRGRRARPRRRQRSPSTESSSSLSSSSSASSSSSSESEAESSSDGSAPRRRRKPRKHVRNHGRCKQAHRGGAPRRQRNAKQVDGSPKVRRKRRDARTPPTVSPSKSPGKLRQPRKSVAQPMARAKPTGADTSPARGNAKRPAQAAVQRRRGAGAVPGPRKARAAQHERRVRRRAARRGDREAQKQLAAVAARIDRQLQLPSVARFDGPDAAAGTRPAVRVALGGKTLGDAATSFSGITRLIEAAREEAFGAPPEAAAAQGAVQRGHRAGRYAPAYPEGRTGSSRGSVGSTGSSGDDSSASSFASTTSGTTRSTGSFDADDDHEARMLPQLRRPRSVESRRSATLTPDAVDLIPHLASTGRSHRASDGSDGSGSDASSDDRRGPGVDAGGVVAGASMWADWGGDAVDLSALPTLEHGEWK